MLEKFVLGMDSQTGKLEGNFYGFFQSLQNFIATDLVDLDDDAACLAAAVLSHYFFKFDGTQQT